MLFWILLILTYVVNRLIIRFTSYLKYFYSKSSSIPNAKVCQTFVISSSQYESIRAIKSFDRSNKLFCNSNLNRHTKLNWNYRADNRINDGSEYQQSKTSLLKYYLETYDPLEIDFIDMHQETLITSNVKAISPKEILNETNVSPIDNCCRLSCTNKQKLKEKERYVRLNEQDNCSATMNLNNNPQIQCHTKTTNTRLPIVMITDCSNSQRLHTNIIEMNENE